jgi:transcriptional regulator with XRE-family HTH domain
MGGLPRRRQRKLPKKLRDIRKRLRVSQDGMLEELGLADEMDRSYISAYERGRLEPPLFVILRYATRVGISTDVLIDDEVDLPEKLPRC